MDTEGFGYMTGMEILTAFGGAALLKKAIPAIAGILISKVNQKLNPTDLQKAIAAGIQAAVDSEPEPKDESGYAEQLFYHCDNPQGVIEKFLSDSGVLEELQKPLESNGEPDLRYLVIAMKKVAEANNYELVESAIEPWLVAFAKAYFENTNSFIRFQVAKQRYLEQIVRRFDNIKFGGIQVEGQEVEKQSQLANIFVMPDVKEDKPGTRSEASDLLDGEFSRQEELLREQRLRFTRQATEAKQFAAKELLKQGQHKKFVLLGDPGAGKTTLLSYFAVMLANGKAEELGISDRLPILIQIRELDRWAKSPGDILKFIRHYAESSHGVDGLPEGFFEHWLDNGKALILLDGLDEVADPARRGDWVDCIDSFLGNYGDNVAIVSSRPAGYRRDYFRMEEFPHYILQPFDDAKIDEFIDRWYDSRDFSAEEAKRRKDTLREALAGQSRIKILAQNPLLLTIITLIHRYQARLPKKRYELYDRAVKTLLTSWNYEKGLKPESLQYLEPDSLERLMQQVAYWIHAYAGAQGGDRDEAGGTLIDRDELIEQLTRFIHKETRIERYKAKEEAKRFLEHIRDRTGLLNEQGQDCYAFVHKTFQEYLAAEDILYNYANEEDPEIVRGHIREHLHDPYWREVLLLMFARLKRKPAAKILDFILKQNSPYEQWLHRDLLFAGDCLAEDVVIENEELVTQVLERLVALEASDPNLVIDKIKAQIFRVIKSLRETFYEAEAFDLLIKAETQIGKFRTTRYYAALGMKEKAVENLLVLLKDNDKNVRSQAALVLRKLLDKSESIILGQLYLFYDDYTYMAERAAEVLEDLDDVSEFLVKKLLELLRDDDPDVQIRATFILAELDNVPEPAVKGLLAMLDHDDSETRSRAILALAEMDNVSEILVDGLLELLDHHDSKTQTRAAELLVKIGNTSEPVINGLLELLSSDDDEEERYIFAQSLLRLGDASEPVINGLLELLNDDDAETRFRAILALSELDDTSEPVINGLLELLNDDDAETRFRAILALSELDDTSESLINGLLELLNHDHAETRFRAAELLVKKGNTSELIVNGLLELLSSDDSFVQLRAAELLVNIGNPSEPVINGLLELLSSDDIRTRIRAIELLVNIGNPSEPVINGLLELLSSDDSFVQLRAAVLLAKIGNPSEPVINGLLELLSSDDIRTRIRAIELLVNIGNPSEPVINGLLELLSSDDIRTRIRAIELLVNIGNPSEPVINGLLELLSSDDSFVQLRAAVLLAKIGNPSEPVINGLLELLNSDDSYLRSKVARAFLALSGDLANLSNNLVFWIEQNQENKYVKNGISILWDLVVKSPDMLHSYDDIPF
jgi:HEAT repeat protein